MTSELLRRNITPESIKAAMRKRHNLAADAPVELKFLPMTCSMSDGHGFSARITTNSLDRDGEVVLPGGMDATEFEKTGTIFWNHNYDLPVAKNVRTKRGRTYVDCEAKFAERPGDYQGEFFPDFARAMVAQGIVKGVSIGFIPVEARQPSKKDVTDFGEDVRRVISKYKLLEWSIAPVQANPDALIQEAIAKGIISADGMLLETKGMPSMACDDCGEMYPEDQLSMVDGDRICKKCMEARKSARAEMIVRTVDGIESPPVELAVPRSEVVTKLIQPRNAMEDLRRETHQAVIASIAKAKGQLYI